MTSNEVKQIRLELKMTQAQFSQALGCTIATLSRWENGIVKPSRLYIKEINALKKNPIYKADGNAKD